MANEDKTVQVIHDEKTVEEKPVEETGPVLHFGSKAALSAEEQADVLMQRIRANERAIAGKEIERFELEILGQDVAEISAVILRSYSIVQALINCYNDLHGAQKAAE